MKKSYRLDEAAKALEISRRTLERAIQRGELQSFRIGGTRRIDHQELLRVSHGNLSDGTPTLDSRPKRKPTSAPYGIESSKSKADLVDLMGNPEERFDAERIKLLRGPIVYAWIRNGRCLYIGRSYTGISRPLTPSHHCITEILPDDEILIWPIADKTTCDRVERDLITKLEPAFNWNWKYSNGETTQR